MSPIADRVGLQAAEVCKVKSASRPRMTISVEEAAVMLGISRWLAYEQIQRDELPHVRMGRRLRVPVRPLLTLVGMTWDDWLAAEVFDRTA